MFPQDLDLVYTIGDWYDGARAGVANYSGKPHYYECQFDESTDDWSDIYLLKPLDEETFRLVMEDWDIWLRWEAAFHGGRTPHETHPALPEDRVRHDELVRALRERLAIDPGASIRAKGDFKYGEPTLVRWSVVP